MGCALSCARSATVAQRSIREYFARCCTTSMCSPSANIIPRKKIIFFPALRLRSKEAAVILDELGREHAHGERGIRELEQALLRYEEGGEREFPAFAAEVERYVGDYYEHMRKEEQLVMPLAEKVLTAKDWNLDRRRLRRQSRSAGRRNNGRRPQICSPAS